MGRRLGLLPINANISTEPTTCSRRSRVHVRHMVIHVTLLRVCVCVSSASIDYIRYIERELS